MDDLAELQQRFRDFSATATPRAPLYAALASRIADDPEVAGLLLAGPPTQRLPVLLLAATHFLVLAGAAPDVAAHYPNLTPTPLQDDPWPAFRQLCSERAAEIRELVASRHTQTNEVGRCATFLPAFGLVAAEVDAPLVQLDVGTSAGLTLLWPSFRYDYGIAGTVGPDSPVVLPCSVRGAAPIPPHLPAARPGTGLDLHPIDIDDEDQVRWLEACVWPDQADRFHRLESAIGISREQHPHVRRGDAVDDLGATISELAEAGHPVVTTSWVLNYLTLERQQAFVAALDTLGRRIDLTWVAAESPEVTAGLGLPHPAGVEHLTALHLTTWRRGTRTTTFLATAHPHGYWLHWLPR